MNYLNNLFNKYWKRTLTSDIIISLSVIIVITIIGLGIFYYIISINSLKKDHYIRAESLMNDLSEILVLPLWNFEDKKIDYIGSIFLRSDYILSIRITDGFDSEVFYEKKEEEEFFTLHKKIYKKKRPIGTVEVVFSKEIIKKTQRTIIVATFLILIFLMIFIVSGSYFLLVRLLGMPLNKLKTGIDTIENGNYDHQLQPVQQVDVNVINQGINSMAATIAKRTNRLEELVEERTAELKEANIKLNEEIVERKNAETALKEKNDELTQALLDIKNTQSQLIQSEKMASLGNLTAGIAHEIKNPLNFIINFSELSISLVKEIMDIAQNNKLDETTYKEIEPDFKRLEQNVDKIYQYGRRADRIIQGMLFHSRGRTSEKVQSDINNLLDESANIAYHGWRAKNSDFNISIVRNYDDAIEAVSVVPQDLSRVFLNILDNAFYSVIKMKENKAAIDSGYSPEVSISSKNLTDILEIRIRDNGTGISEENRDKIFEPFFSAKPVGDGTGLGLSICYDIIVKEHKGTISVETELEQFTEFVITLPKVII